MSHNARQGVLIAIVLALIIVSGIAGYLYQASNLQPIIETLELENTQRIETIQRLNASLQYSVAINSIQNTTISNLKAEKVAIEESLTNTSQQLSKLLEELDETKQTLDFYKTLSRRFYETNPIRIGVTSPTSADDKYIRYLVEKVELDIHGYCIEQDLPYRFDFVVGNNMGSTEVTLINMINYDALGINLIVGHFSDSECSVSLNYANNNDMILLSPGSSSAKLSVKYDNLFRLATNETLQLDVNIAAMKSMDIKAVVVFSVNSDWGRTMSQTFSQKLSDTGIKVYHVLYYPDAAPNISIYPQIRYLSNIIFEAISENSKDHVALQIFGHDRINDLLDFSYTYIFHIVWFGTEVNTLAFKSASERAQKVLLLSPVQISKSPSFSKFNQELSFNYGFNVSYYGANIYDACWLYALSIIKTGSTKTQDIKEVLPMVARDYQGVTGNHSFNAYGDRDSVDYSLMGYSYINNAFVEFGYYNSTQNTIEWSRIHPKIP